MKHLCWGLLLLPFFLNCATHAPMSEMVMFSPKKVKPENSVSGDTLFYSRFSFAGGFEYRGIDPYAVNEYADARYEESGERGSADYYEGQTFSLHAMLLSEDNSDFAFNISIIPLLGIDATFRITDKEYLTFAHTAYGGQQVILQRRLVYNYHVGLAAGLFYEHIWQGYDFESDCGFCIGPDRIFFLDAIGVRVMAFDHNGMKNRVFLKGNIKAGYIPKLETFSFGVGGSVGIF